MRPPVPDAGMPSLSAQLAMLSPNGKLFGGTLMLLLGGGALALDSDSLASWILILVAGCLGVPLLLRGMQERGWQRLEAAELERARSDLPALRIDIAEAQADRRGVDRLLRDRGYTTEKARRWIALECDIVLPRAEE
jgi:hypothetical protein